MKLTSRAEAHWPTHRFLRFVTLHRLKRLSSALLNRSSRSQKSIVVKRRQYKGDIIDLNTSEQVTGPHITLGIMTSTTGPGNKTKSVDSFWTDELFADDLEEPSQGMEMETDSIAQQNGSQSNLDWREE